MLCANLPKTPFTKGRDSAHWLQNWNVNTLGTILVSDLCAERKSVTDLIFWKQSTWKKLKNNLSHSQNAYQSTQTFLDKSNNLAYSKTINTLTSTSDNHLQSQATSRSINSAIAVEEFISKLSQSLLIVSIIQCHQQPSTYLFYRQAGLWNASNLLDPKDTLVLWNHNWYRRKPIWNTTKYNPHKKSQRNNIATKKLLLNNQPDQDVNEFNLSTRQEGKTSYNKLQISPN
jgi:hypothetical protein